MFLSDCPKVKTSQVPEKGPGTPPPPTSIHPARTVSYVGLVYYGGMHMYVYHTFATVDVRSLVAPSVTALPALQQACGPG